MVRALAQTFQIDGFAPEAAADIGLPDHRFDAGTEATQDGFTLYDTFDGALAGTGYALLEIAGNLWLLSKDGITLSQPGSIEGFVAQMAPGPIKSILTRIVSPLRRLLVQVQGTLGRQPMALLDDEDKTVVRMTQWSLMTADGSAVSLLELRGMRGYDKAFDRLSTALAAAKGSSAFNPKRLQKTLGALSGTYDPKPDIAMAAEATAFEAATAIVSAYIDVARANEDGTIADLDSEFLHDYRVALRKLRSVVSLFKGVYSPDQTEDLKARFGALMAVTGRLRDLDVYLIERDAYLDLVPRPLRPGLTLLFDDFATERAAVQKDVAAHLTSAAYKAEIKALDKLFAKSGKKLEKGPMAEDTAHHLASQLIWKRYRKVCRIAASITDATPDEQVHELRIHCKKLRYLMEFFAPVFDKARVKALIKALKGLQDVLGDFNDYAVQQDSMMAALDKIGTSRSQRSMEIAKSTGALLTVLHQHQQDARSHVVDSFDAFDSQETRAEFRALFKPQKQKETVA